MPAKAHDDDLVMNLVELALALPAHDRETYLRDACSGDLELFKQAWHYVQWEERMNGFLLDPLYPPATYEHPFDPGELLDERFRIVREVAQGGMGVVYEATDEKLQRRIALKCAKTGFRKRLPPEVRNATAISHPNVCKIFEIHTASSRQGEIDFLTMEFLDGETLAERLLRGPLPEAEARTIARQLCAGLAEAHRNQVIHGDLKSNNIILTTGADGAIRAVITDFGLARAPEAAQRNLQSGQIGGTPDYMAPELWRGEKATIASDIYALGVILYELASGERPHPAETPWEERLTRKLPSAHPKWDRVLARCLDADPARRFRSADEVAEALAPRSRRWFLTAAAAVVLAVTTGTLTYQRAKAPQESVRLAILPFESDGAGAALSEGLFRDAAGQLAHLKGSARTRLTVIAPNKTQGATHALRASLKKVNDKVIVQAYLTDARSQINANEWKAEYTPGELRYLPVALAGMVTGTLRIPPLVAAATVNPAARQDYLNGLSSLRRDTGIDAALPSMERAVASDPDSPLTHAGLAEAQWFKYFLTKDKSWLERATESERQAELRYSDLAPVHRITGRLNANAGRYEQAEAEYRRAIELEPNNSDGYRRLGQVLEQNNRLDEALAAYRRAVEVEPGYYRSYQELGTFYNQHGNYAEAVKQFKKMVELAPDEPNAHYALGVAYLNSGRYGEAEGELRFAIHLAETPTALHALGHVLMYEGRDQEAIPYISRALSRGPESYLWWMNLGIAYRRVNLKVESERANRRALQLAEDQLAADPRNATIRSRLAYVCARVGETRRAESEIAQALQLSPNDADTRWMAALTYEALAQRGNTLAVLSASADGVVADLSRWPDVADLYKDSRFVQLLASRQIR
ncbi:MAG TPA: tetratricopeptide repeat protein [Bryobacteraceae bacterium]|nr:tetratricopeptide repeat protein [Bryobacteraceae bacterium]